MKKAEDNIKKHTVFINALPAILVFIMLLILGFQKNYSPDVGFHLQSAKWMIQNGHMITTDSFTYTSFGNNYYDMQWLYQFVIYGIFTLGKDGLLIIVNSILISLSFFVVLLRCKNLNSSGINLALASLLIIIGVQALPFEIRPHVFSWLFLNVILLILENYKNKDENRLYLIPVILFFWVNIHSLAILGLVVIGVYIVGSYLETKKADSQLLKLGGISLLFFCITPYFLNGFLFVFSQFGIISGAALQKSYIGEIQSPFTLHELKAQGLAYFLNPLFYLQLYALTSIIIGVRLLTKKRITEGLLIMVFFVLLYLAIKNYGFFLMVTLPIVMAYIQAWLEKRQLKKKLQSQLASKRLVIIACTLAVFISWITITDGLSMLRHSPYHFGFSVDKESVPVEATDFLNRNKIYGKIMNHLDFGGYLMYNYPEKVFIDGRIELPKQDFFKKYYNALKPSGFEKLISEYDPDIILLPYNKATGWWSFLINSKLFRPVYFDGLSAIYLKNGKFDQIPELNEKLVNSKIDSTVSKAISNIIKEDKPGLAKAIVNSLFQKQYYPINEQNMATFCFTYGYMKAALYYSAKGIERATVNPKNTYYNLELYFKKENKYVEAEICRKKSKL